MSRWYDKKCLVTGSTGLIGSNLADKLTELKARVRKTRGRHLDDLTNPENCDRLTVGIDTVFHCAAVSEGAKTIKEDPKKVITPNVIMTAYLLDKAQKNNVKNFVYLSSTTVDHPFEYQGIAHMKRFGEELCQFYRDKYGMSTTIIRPTNVYGPNDKFDERGHVIPNLIKRALSKENPFVVWGTGNNSRDFIYVEDLIHGILEAKDGTYTIGSGTHTTIKQLVGTLFSVLDYFPSIVFDTSKPDAIGINHPELNIIKNRTSLEEGLRKTIRWYQERKSQAYMEDEACGTQTSRS